MGRFTSDYFWMGLNESESDEFEAMAFSPNG